MNKELLKLKWLPSWVGVIILRLIAFIPYPVLVPLGRLLGRAGYFFSKGRRKIAERNLELCFPELTGAEKEKLLKKNFESLGISILEIPVSWWASQDRMIKLGHVAGIENLNAAMAKGKGVILLSAHFTCLEIGTRILTNYASFHVMYRQNENPVIERVMAGSRRRWCEKAIPRDSVRDMIRSLREGRAVWYAPDQNSQRKMSVFVKFFGHLASTNTGTARLAKMTGAAVVPFKATRRDDGKGYDLELEPALDNYPVGDIEADTQRINDIIERWVRENPDQYLWIHRRFRTRPNLSDPPIY